MKDINTPELSIVKYHTLTASIKNFNKGLNQRLDEEDQKLWEQFSQGEDNAFRGILYRYGVNVLRVVLKYVRSNEIAKHLTEAIFTALYRKRYELIATELEKFLIMETKNRILEQLTLLVKERLAKRE